MNKIFIIFFCFVLCYTQIIRFPSQMEMGHIVFNGNMTLYVDRSLETLQFGGEFYYVGNEKVFLNMSTTHPGENAMVTSWIHYGGSIPQPFDTGFREVLILFGYGHSTYDTCIHYAFDPSNFYSTCKEWIVTDTNSDRIYTQKCNVTNTRKDNALLNGEITFLVLTKKQYPTIPVFIQTKIITKKDNASSIFELFVLSTDDHVPDSIWVSPRVC